MIRRPPRSTRTDTLCPYTTLFRSRVLRYLVSTPSLEKSATTPLRINVILPTDYDHHPKRHYPVLYALPGTSNTADVWLDNIDPVEMTESMPLNVLIPDGHFDPVRYDKRLAGKECVDKDSA